jgi:hypothetical protein
MCGGGRRTSKEAAQAPVRDAQCLQEGLVSSIYQSQWSGAPFLRHHLVPPFGSPNPVAFFLFTLSPIMLVT